MSVDRHHRDHRADLSYLEGLGYQVVTQILSIPVTYASIKNRQIDVYLGDWQPSMEVDRKPFLADGSFKWSVRI